MQTRADFLCTNLLWKAHLPAVAHWSEMRHTHRTNFGRNFPLLRGVIAFFAAARVEMKQKGEKRAIGESGGAPLTTSLAPPEAQSREGVHQTPPLDQKPSAGRSNYLFLRRPRPAAQLPTALPLVAFDALWFVHWGASAKLCALYAHRIIHCSRARPTIGTESSENEKGRNLVSQTMFVKPRKGTKRGDSFIHICKNLGC